MMNVKAKVVAATLRRSSMLGMTPAWKRHCIRQRKKALCDSSSPDSATATNIATMVPKDSNFASVVHQIKSFSIGTFAGLMGSLAGMGGGFVMIPMMTAARTTVSSGSKGLWLRGGLGLHQHQAHGTSLFAVGTTGLAGALGYGINMSDSDEASIENDMSVADAKTTAQQQQPTTDAQNQPRKGLVELDTALALAATAMITARFGAIASSRLSESSLQRALGAFMIFVAPLVPGKAYLEALYDVNNPSNPDVHKHIDEDVAMHPKHSHMSQLERLLPASVIGIFSGFLSGMFGVGGGAIVVPALVLSTDMSHHSALGTSLCAMVLPAMVGTYTHSKRGNVNWRVAPILALGSAAGAFIGGREVSLNLDEGVLRTGFSCLMLVLGVRTW
eukprot:CAMPEP_0172307550 /NCGR_PEP_ID=MMETSP1058-20130122/8382_1 /TAXON_ID=83371 /ORGANISM="Detonula confervacea, Strain CCMP 353" /LENGTH=387 /DNA_ID=CAMNT_0013019751 /DNA_START=205 /DNA_END=1365 /DNA_ORIENTATION=+